MHEQTELDLRYLKLLSWRTDLEILLCTMPVILGSREGI